MNPGSLKSVVPGEDRNTDATTTQRIKLEAPTSSPTAISAEPELMAEYVENTSGDPFPNASNVTPMRLSEMRRVWEMATKLGHRKSEAAVPMPTNSAHRYRASTTRTGARSRGGEHVYASARRGARIPRVPWGVPWVPRRVPWVPRRVPWAVQFMV